MRGSLRVLSVPVACFLVLSQLAAFLHFFTVGHSACPEHGELVHAALGHPATAASSLDSPGRVKGGTIERGPESDAAHEHDHCMICSQRREHATLQRAPVVVPPHLGAELGLARDGSARIHSSVPLYLLAPKNSPPV
jgi:hypothetical protein